MATQLRDCAEDPKILERASDLYAERPNREDIAELEALIRSEAKRRRMVFSSEREAVSPSRLEEVSRMTTHGMTRKHHQFSVNTSENRSLLPGQ